MTPHSFPTSGNIRCDWATTELGIAYHDREWGVPTRDDRRLFEFLILEGAQAGLSWETILRKREAYRRVFAQFDPEKVARFNRARMDRLMQDEGIVRNRLKIQSAVGNAKAFLRVQEEFNGFAPYIWRFVDGQPKVNRWKTMKQVPAKTKESDAMSRDLKQRGFNFVGSTIMYAYMQATGMVNDHLTGCFRVGEMSRRYAGN